MIRSEIVRASAGSGKTHYLTDRIHKLIHTRNPFVIAVTFTRAATAEMRKRILDWVDESPVDYLDKLQQIMRAGRVHFATFDSFFYQLLAAHGDPIQIADEKETEIIKEQIEKVFFDEIHKADKVEEIIIACKLLGTSIENLTEKLADDGAQRFLENNISGGRFSRMVTETAMLKEEIKQLLDALEKEDSESLPARMRNSVIGLSSADLQKLVEKAAFTHPDLSDWEWLGKKIDWSSSPFTDINRVFIKIRERLAGYLLNRALLRELTLTEMYGVYRSVATRVKRKGRKIFFRDVLERLIALDGRDAPVKAEIMGLYFELGLDRVHHFMIDEFQDTSKDNMAIVLPLVEEILSEVGENGEGDRSLFVVGDRKQMIYAWRGADRDAIEQGLSQYQGAQLQHNFLPYNWRSTPLLIDFFNRTVSEIFPGDERKEHQQQPPNKQFGGISEINLCKVKVERQQKDPLYDRMIETIETKKAEWGCDYSDMTLLFRTNTEKEAMAQKLAEAGIGFAEVKGRQMLASEEGVSVFFLLAHLFAKKGSGFIEKALEVSCFGEALLKIARDKEQILQCYASPYGLKAVTDILEMCRGSIPDAVIETYEEEAETFFRAGGNDVEDLLSYIFKVRDKLTVPEPAHSDRVKLATIHSSKGLEFPHVFLLWIEQNHPFPFYVPDSRCHMSFNSDETKFWENYDSPMAHRLMEAQSREREKIENEKANILYVAITRATHSITIFVKDSAKERDGDGKDELTRRLVAVIENSSFDAECRRGLDSLSWRKDYGAGQEKAGQEVVEIAPVSLPSAEGKVTDGVEVDRSLISMSIKEGIERGARIHNFWTMLKDSSSIPEQHGLSLAEFDTVASFLKDEKVSEVIFRNGKVYIEQPVSNRELYGVVDRMIIEDDRITLIDFKTGAPGDLLDSYREQVRRYGAIIKSLYPERTVEVYLLFVDAEEMVIRVHLE
jgi:ATP-dependent exoDNAse (exonuclease V) beta subunit